MAFVLLSFMGLIVAFAIVAAFLPRPSRECPNCAGAVPLTAPRCKTCGYQFAPDGSSSRYIR